MPAPNATCGFGLPVQDDLVGPVERGRVAVGRREEERELLAARDRHAGDLDVLEDPPLEHRAPACRSAGAPRRPSGRGPAPPAAARAPRGAGRAPTRQLPAPLTDASWPALRRRIAVATSSSSVRRSPVSATRMRSLRRSSPGRRAALADEVLHVGGELRAGRHGPTLHGPPAIPSSNMSVMSADHGRRRRAVRPRGSPSSRR